MHPSSDDLYRTISDIGMVREDGYLYSPDLNKQALLMRIESLQEEVTRLNKTIAEKDAIIVLLKEVIAHSSNNNRKKKGR
jgi:hypothetical protein